jgi:hypothetical protein
MVEFLKQNLNMMFESKTLIWLHGNIFVANDIILENMFILLRENES